jgi:hypothetical protein
LMAMFRLIITAMLFYSPTRCRLSLTIFKQVWVVLTVLL